jgi:hypothetical protein
MTYKVAGIDIHKKVLMVVVTDAAAEELTFESRRFGTGASEREHLVIRLRAGTPLSRLPTPPHSSDLRRLLLRSR